MNFKLLLLFFFVAVALEATVYGDDDVEVAALKKKMSTDPTSCYDIAANSNRVCTENASGAFPESKPDYFFYNIGKTEVFVEAVYGTAFGWIDRVAGRTLQPGESTIIRMGTKPYYTTGQKVTNRDGNRRALVCCTTL